MSKSIGSFSLGASVGMIINAVWHTDHWWQFLVTALILFLVGAYFLGDAQEKNNKK